MRRNIFDVEILWIHKYFRWSKWSSKWCWNIVWELQDVNDVKFFGKRFLEFNDEEAQDQVRVIQAQDVSEEQF